MSGSFYWRTLPLLLVAIVYLAFFFAFNRWHEAFRGGDPWGYYAHLPAFFIYHDVGDYTKTIAAASDRWGGTPNSMLATPIGRQCDKYPLGVATFLTPFFGLAHAYASVSNTYAADGYSEPYALCVGLGIILYVLLGLWLLSGLLRRYFSGVITVLLLLSAALGTNLFYFSTYNNLMSHALLFAIYCGLLYVTQRFYDQPSARRAAWVGLLVGCIAMTRLHEAIAVLIPLFWGVTTWSGLRERGLFFFNNKKILFTAVAMGMACLLPQSFYYQYVSGTWWWYAYQGESFDFRHPHLFDGLFSYKNGWLVYTPIMFLSILGVLKIRRYAPVATVPLLTFMPLHIWITYSWWCWNYINGFGSRPMVETYPLLLFPLGAFFAWGSNFWVKRGASALLVLYFIGLNIFQTYQLSQGLIWTEDGKKAHYWAAFGKLANDRNTLIAYYSGESQPKDSLTFAKLLLHNDMEDSTNADYTRECKHSGNFGVFLGGEFAGTVGTQPPVEGVLPGDWLRASVWGFVRRNDHNFPREHLSSLIVEMRNGKEETVKYCGLKIASFIGNHDWSIWNIGEPEKWGEAYFFVKIPPDFKPDWSIRAYVWNPAKHRYFVDDLKIEVWR
jgi:hypothetical protein